VPKTKHREGLDMLRKLFAIANFAPIPLLLGAAAERPPGDLTTLVVLALYLILLGGNAALLFTARGGWPDH
jgi:hypothetical protein